MEEISTKRGGGKGKLGVGWGVEGRCGREGGTSGGKARKGGKSTHTVDGFLAKIILLMPAVIGINKSLEMHRLVSDPKDVNEAGEHVVGHEDKAPPPITSLVNGCMLWSKAREQLL